MPSAKQLRHAVAVAERHYVGLVGGIPASARTLEAAMQIEEMMGWVVAPRSGAIHRRVLTDQSR
jgi:hypothetical protein